MKEGRERSRGRRFVRRLMVALVTLAAIVAALLVGVALRGRDGLSGKALRDAPCTPAQPCLAIVIDDIGRDLAALRELLALSDRVTLAVLPHAAQSEASVELLAAQGREYWLHLPLEPRDETQVTDEAVLIRRGNQALPVLHECLRRVPGARGVNNHMGSALSEDREALAPLLQGVARLGLPFLDSKTTSRSQICRVAGRVGVRCIERDVFLDDARDLATVGERLREAARLARRRGWAVAVGHPYRRTIGAIGQQLRQGLSVRLVRLSKVAEGAMGAGRASTGLSSMPLDAAKWRNLN